MTKRTCTRVFTKLLILALSVGVLTSCSKKDPYADMDHNINAPKYISENDEWWDASEFSVITEDLSFDVKSKDISINSKLAAVTDKNIYVYYGGWNYKGDNVEGINEIACFSIEEGSEGEFIGFIDLASHLSSEDCFVNDIGGVYEVNGEIHLLVTLQYTDNTGLKTYDCVINITDKSIGELNELKFDSASGKDNISVNEVVCVNGTAFLKCYSNMKACIYTLNNGMCHEVRTDNFDFIDTFEKYDDNNIILLVTSYERTKYMLLNTSSLSFTEIEDYKGEYSVEDHSLVVSDGKGGEKTPVIDFNNTLLSVYMYKASNVLSATDERIILKCNAAGMDNTIVILTKAETNPNAGKQIIEAAHLDMLTILEANGISEFNKRSEAYFIKDNEDYNYWSVFDWDAAMIDYNAETNRAKSEKINALMADIASGEGPDVILDSSDCREIQNGKYLVNMDSLIKDLKLDSKEYFTNIIEASDIDGRKYTLPLEVSVQGLLIDNEEAKGLGTGIKIKDYSKFVSEVCNNNDPMYLYQSQMAYFDQLVAISFDLYESSDGRVNFDNQDFRALAEYVHENVPETITYNEGRIRSVSLYGVTTDYEQYGISLSNRKLIGLPSPDGRGPCYRFTSCASIAACSSCQEGCWQFISSMLNEDIQKYASAIPVSRNAFTSLAVTVTDGKPIDQAVIDNYVSIISNGTFYYSTDYSIRIIIDEEMPSYFDGQKSLDEVIKIIEIRVNLMIAERG